MIITVQPNYQRKIKDLSIISNDETRKLPKTLTVFFLIIQLVFCLDYGFIEHRSRNKKIFFKCLNLIVALLWSSLLVFSLAMVFGTAASLQCTAYLLEYFIYLLILALSNNSFCNLLKDLIIVDEAMGVDTRIYNLQVKLITSILAIFLYKTLYSYIICFYYENLCISLKYVQILYSIFAFGLDVGLLINFFVFYVVYCRLQQFVKYITRSDMKIVHCEHIYKSLADSTDVAKQSFDHVFALTILFYIPTAMITIYYTLKEYKTTQHYDQFVHQYILILQALLQLFAPAVASEWVSAHVDKIKVILHNKLLLSEDEGVSQELIRFLRYIEARPFKFSVYNLIPLDYTLPIIALDICVTYLIVIIQFTHLY